MKKMLFFLTVFLASIQMWAQTVTITEQNGWLESAYVKWTPVSGATSYNVYYTGGGQTNVKIDTQLIRSYGSYFRADVLGLAAGTYTVTVKPVVSGVEQAGATSSSITVLAHDRNGFAFQGGHIPSAYNMDGTPKTGAVILYITQNTKNTISLNVTGATTNPCVGLQPILTGYAKGKDTRPLIIRLIGNVTDLDVLTNGDLYIANNQNSACSLTFEGVGNDAVTNGWSVCLKSATNIEVRNVAAMNNNSTNGDDFGLQQDNDHVWIHNNEMFYGDAGSDADQVKGDGAMDVKLSSYITISYNHFWDNGKCSLLGLSEDTTSGLYITYHHNWFDHSDSRHPRVRFYSAHVYNNYYDGNSKYGAGSTLGSSVFSEGNYYRDAKYPMLTSLQGSDIWDSAAQKNNISLGIFSNEAGGTIKAFNNTFDQDGGTNDMRFVAYGNTSFPNSTVDFDAYLATTRGEQVPSTVKSFSGANTYNNFDTDATLYVKNLTIDTPIAGRDKTKAYAGRTGHGDLQWTFNNATDDADHLVVAALKAAVTNYTTKLVAIQGENTPAGSQTITSTSNNNQTVASGAAISTIVFTWGGDATDATVTGLPASGISFVKNTTNKTITITGTPTANVSYSINTSGTAGTSTTGSGTITITPTSVQSLTSTSNNNQTVASGTAINSIVFTWGGSATDANVTGLPASGISAVKNTTTKTITITGTPTANVSYSVSTNGTGTAVTTSGSITVTVQTLTSTSNNNQTVASGTAISSIIYTWGGDATDATITGLPASGVSYVKNTTNKTITITGSPTSNISYSISTIGAGTAATGSGTITVKTSSTPDQVQNFTTSGKTSTFYTITGNMNSTDGLVTYAGLTLTSRLKIESSTSIKFTTTATSTLTLVFDSNFTGTIMINNVSYTAAAGIVTTSIPAGLYTITKGSVAQLYYISTKYNTTSRMKQNTVVENSDTTKLVLYPNPVTNQLNISSDSKADTVIIYNMTGSIVKNLKNNIETIDMSDLSSGSYLVKVHTENGTELTKIVVKK